MLREEDWRKQIFRPRRDGAPMKKSYDVFCAKAGQQRRAAILSNEVLQCTVHYSEKESKPCLQTPGCPWCNKRWPRRWKGYLCGFDLQEGRKVIIELTQGAFESCPRLVTEGSPLRGLVLTLGRRGAARNSPVWARLDDAYCDARKGSLSPAWNLEAALFVLWEMNDQVAGQLVELVDGWDGTEPQAPPPSPMDGEG